MGSVLEINNLRFKTEIVPVLDGKSLYECVLIVLKDFNTGQIVEVTKYSNITFTKEIINTRKNTRLNLSKAIVQFLNYLFFDREFIKREIKSEDVLGNKKIRNLDKIENLTIEDANYFLNDYKRGLVGINAEKDRSSVKQIQQYITRFCYFLAANYKLKYIDFSYIKKKTVIYESYSRLIKKEVIETPFTVILPKERTKGGYNIGRLQNISFFALAELIDLAIKYAPMISLPIAEQAFAGLRGSEVCNTTKFNTSCSYIGNELVEWRVDLRSKPILRSDGIDVGEIKSREIASVHPAFLPFFNIIKNEHEQYINQVFKKKNSYGAMFMTRDGNAMTYEDYRYHFSKLIEKLISRLKASNNYRAREEAEIIIASNFTTHTLRFFFSQMVASMPNTTIFEVAMYRRDKTLQSAMTYIRNNPYLIDDKIRNVQKEMIKKIKGYEGF